jgi:hypothetical protein
MKRMIAIALLAVVGFIVTASVTADTPQQAHYQAIQYTVPPVPVMTTCNVNGMYYQVDYTYPIWGLDSLGRWFVLGLIVNTPSGFCSIRNDGVQFPASC